MSMMPWILIANKGSPALMSPLARSIFIATNGAANFGPMFVSFFQLDPDVTYTFGRFNTDSAAPHSSLVPCLARGVQLSTSTSGKIFEDLEAIDILLTLVGRIPVLLRC